MPMSGLALIYSKCPHRLSRSMFLLNGKGRFMNPVNLKNHPVCPILSLLYILWYFNFAFCILGLNKTHPCHAPMICSRKRCIVALLDQESIESSTSFQSSYSPSLKREPLAPNEC